MTGASWRQAARILAATAIAYALTSAFHLHTGYWAMITAAIVVQSNLGGTLDAGLTQFAGTAVGGLLGIVGVWLRLAHGVEEWLVLPLVLAPLALLSARDAHLRTGPVAALIVLFVSPQVGHAYGLALVRVAEITLGGGIGIGVALLLFPNRAAAALDRQIATGLPLLGVHACAVLNGRGPDRAGSEALAAVIDSAEASRVALTQERAWRLVGAAPADPLPRGLRRLRTDIAIIGRAVDGEPPLPELGDAVQAWCEAAAMSLRDGCGAPDLAAIEAAAACLPRDRPLGFAVQMLQRDLSEFADRLTECAATRRAGLGMVAPD